MGFDFDAITGHAAGISDEELNRVREAAQATPYARDIGRSTGGAGLHLYVHLDCIPTANHTEHAAVARAVMAKMSRDAGFDFKGNVDCVGGILWIWSRRATAENGGLTCIKAATQVLTESDIGEWRDSRVKPSQPVRPAVPVRSAIEEDEDHKRIIAAYRQPYGETQLPDAEPTVATADTRRYGNEFTPN